MGATEDTGCGDGAPIILHDSEARFRRAQAVAHVGSWQIDLATASVWGSDEAFRIYGLASADSALPLAKVQSLVLPEYRSMLDDALASLLNGTSTYDVEFRIRRQADGAIRYVRSLAEVVRDAEGKALAIEGTVQDITGEKEAARALEDSLRRFESMFANAPTMAIQSYDREGIVLRWNRFSEVLHGVHTVRALGMSAVEVFPDPLDAAEFFRKLDAIVTSRQPAPPHERRIVTRGGAARWLHTTMFPVLIDGDVGEVFCMDLDITERKRVEDVLRASDASFRTLFESSYDAILLTRNGTVVRCNQRATDLFCCDRADLVGHTLAELLSTQQTGNADQVAALERQAEHALEANPPSFAAILKRRDGTRFPAELSLGKLSLDGDAHLQVIVRDVTERLRVEEQLLLRNRMDSIGTLAGGIAHDFNNILAAIMGYVDLLGMVPDQLDARQREYVDNILKACRRGSDLVGSLSALRRSDRVGKTTFDLHKVAAEAFHVIGETTDRVIQKQMLIVPGVFFIEADESGLYHALMNLGLNAVHAIGEKGATGDDMLLIDAQAYEARTNDVLALVPGKYVHVTVRDTGTGMTPEVRSRAFDPLFTTKGKSKDKRKSQGLGLTMVYKTVVQQHGGWIDVESAPGMGTTFHLYLPRAATVAPQEDAPRSFVAHGHQTILVVDDEPQLLQLSRIALETVGYRVLTAQDGEEALVVFERERKSIALVVLDRSLPKLPGEKVMAELLRRVPSIKVLISSGEASVEPADFPGALGVLRKPYLASKLCEAVGAALQG